MRTSVLINTDQNARFLAECLESVLGQTGRPDGIVLADNGSTDHTAEMLAGYARRIETLQGRIAGRNRRWRIMRERSTRCSVARAAMSARRIRFPAFGVRRAWRSVAVGFAMACARSGSAGGWRCAATCGARKATGAHWPRVLARFGAEALRAEARARALLIQRAQEGQAAGEHLLRSRAAGPRRDRRTKTARAGRAGASARARQHSRRDTARPALAQAMPQLNPHAGLRSFAKQFRQMRGEAREAAFPIPDFLPEGGP